MMALMAVLKAALTMPRAQTALLDMVRGVMAKTAEKGLPGAHHFYITFASGRCAIVRHAFGSA